LIFRNEWLKQDPNALDGSVYSLGDFPRLASHFRHEEFPLYLRLGGFPAIHLKEYTQDEAYAIVHDIYVSIPPLRSGTNSILKWALPDFCAILFSEQ
jgi:hypothetical protein